MIGLFYNYNERGPGKVISNLSKGFDMIGVDYSHNINGDKNIILQGCNRLNDNLSNCILGPNICTLPIDNKVVMNYENYEKLIVPSDWVKKLYMKWIPESKIDIWAVGIDTDKFNVSENDKDYDFLIYFKRRDIGDLEYVTNILNKNGDSYHIIEYGNYEESHFIDIISRSKFGIVIDNCESQGIAIEEMMSCNLPLLVWDVKDWIDRGIEYKCESTSIPYWDNRCGEVFYERIDFDKKLETIKVNIYSPRDYILENLTLEGQSKKILKINE